MHLMISLAYLVAVALFVLGLKRLSSPRTARMGNVMASAAMLLAIVVTLLHQEIVTYWMIIAGLLVGSAIGAVLARRVQMTEMPQMVAAFNGFGGLASALVGISEYIIKSGWSVEHQIARSAAQAQAALGGVTAEAGNEGVAAAAAAMAGQTQAVASAIAAAVQHSVGLPVWVIALSAGISILIGCVTFSGSFVAFGKLQGLKITPSRPVTFPNREWLTLGVLAGSLVLLGLFTWLVDPFTLILLFALTLALGVLLVMPIGGADMPVVVSLLNSYSGLAACATGFVLSNELLIVSGALVGASGIILTQIMCKAMNRSLVNVLVGGFGGEVAGGGKKTGDGQQRTVASYDVFDAAQVIEGAQSLVIVPGYGLAVAQAQHSVRELDKTLEARGVKVRYAIHPVAGRMPGHMNVLLAEADVPYDKLLTMDEINPEFGQTDVVLVLGANDVINPAARDEPGSPIYGMPILEVDKAGTVMIVKRSMASGYAGIENELFYSPKTMMLFGDAKKVVQSLTEAVKS